MRLKIVWYEDFAVDHENHGDSDEGEDNEVVIFWIDFVFDRWDL